MAVKKLSLQWVIALVLVAAVAVYSTWRVAAREVRQCRVDQGLAPVAALLQENQKIFVALAAGGYTGTEPAIIERYLSDIRRDGVPKHTAARRNIDALVDNNTLIVALLANHASSLRTLELGIQSEKFRAYAASLRERWRSTFELFMAGGGLPAAGPERPTRIVAAVSAEIAAQ